MCKNGQIAAFAMPTCGKGNDEQTAMLVMATHNKGDNRQITGARGNGDVRQVDGLPRECNDGQIVVLTMATHSEGNNGQVAGTRNGHAWQK